MTTKSLVTGAKGFVGRHLVAALAARGDEVTATDLGSETPGEGETRYVEADLRDEASVATVVEGHDVVFHNASVVHTRRTSDPLIWGSGDVLSLADLPVAIGHGEEVAVSIEQALNPGKIASFPWREVHSPDVAFDPDRDPVERARVQTEYSSVEERIASFLLVNRGVNWDEAIRKEAERCLRCDYRDVCN